MKLFSGGNCENILLLLITISSIFAEEQRNEIIEIKNKTQIHCVSENSDDLTPMFTSPPLNKVRPKETLIETKFWMNDDWTTKNSSHVRGGVFDSRWEDFEVENMQYLRFDSKDTDSSLSFSVYGTHDIEYYVDTGNSVDIFKVPLNNLEDWTTITIFMKENFIYFYKNDKEQIEKNVSKPTQIGIRTSEMAYIKTHAYNYKEATTVTADKPSTLLIPPHSKKFRLILYVSLCKSCILEVQHNDQTLNIHSDTTENDILEKWQTQQLILDPLTSEDLIHFIRKKSNDSEEGYWKLDARLDDNEIVTATFAVDHLSEKYKCNYLSASNKQDQFRRKRHSPVKSATDITSCPAGKVGTKCDISCDNVLGQQYSLCEHHSICTDSMPCKCAWGFHGNWCEEDCDDGKWGINCEKSCQACDSCNKQTGECTTHKGPWIIWTGIISGWSCIVLIIIGTIYRLKKTRSEQPKSNDGSEQNMI